MIKLIGYYTTIYIYKEEIIYKSIRILNSLGLSKIILIVYSFQSDYSGIFFGSFWSFEHDSSNGSSK